MAENSKNCKTWCVSIISALLVFSSKTMPLPWFALLLPILPLLYLDIYYLALETFYRQEYNKSIQKFKDGNTDVFNVYDMESPKGKLEIFHQIRSQSIWPFYGLLLVLAGIISYYLAAQSSCCVA